MYASQYSHYPPAQRNYASIQQFANYAALQLEVLGPIPVLQYYLQQASRDARIKEMKHAHEMAMFQQYGGGANMTSLYECTENRPASVAGGGFHGHGGAIRSSSTPDRLKSTPLEPMAKEQLAWYLKVNFA